MAEMRTRDRSGSPQERASERRVAPGCPNCSQPIAPGADLCENCGTWLKPGCVFCGASTRARDELCGSCGEPWQGILCGACGTFSRFDCCPGCGGALTARAVAMVAEIESDPQLMELSQLTEELAAPPWAVPPLDPHAAAKSARQALIANLGADDAEPEAAPVAPKPEAGADELLESTGLSRGQVKKMVDRQEVEARLARALTALQDRSFASAQEARAYFESFRLVVKTVIPKIRVIGWRCNAYGVTHPEGPHQCAAPSGGGQWVTEVAGVEIVSSEVELG